MRRLAQMVPVLFGVTIIVFVMVHLIPGSPAAAMLGPNASDAAVANLNRQLGLDKPLYVQYVYFIRNLAELNLGKSTKFNVPVSSLVFHRLAVSLSIVAVTVILTIIISIPLGILAALKKDSVLDNIVRSALMVTMVMPSFWVGIILILFFSIRLKLLPVSGYGSNPPDHIRHLLLPALTISLGLAPILIRALRNSILEIMQTEYVKTARSKGLAERTVVTVHVLRNALIPTVTLLGISIGFLMGGTVIIERVFSLPGAGALLIDAVSARDYPTVQAATLIFAFLVIVVNLATDIIYSFIDPRVRYS
jgi:peptide/nickel transport system permease protein